MSLLHVRRQLRCVLALVVAAFTTLSTATAGEASQVPSNATHVSVAQAATTTGVDGHLAPAASIAGRVTDTAGDPLVADVFAFRGGKTVTSTASDADTGRYVLRGLSAGQYAVCVETDFIHAGGTSHTGYVDRCYRSVLWNGRTNDVPTNAALVDVTSGQHATGIRFQLRAAAAIAGTVTSGSGTGLLGVSVWAKNNSHDFTYRSTTGDKGRYRFSGLMPSSSGYTVCFDPKGSGGPPAEQGRTGFRPRCYNNVDWAGVGHHFPPASTAVAVRLGETHRRVSQSLRIGGAISGKVVNGATGKPVVYMPVAALNSKGRLIDYTQTDYNGRYTIKGLAASRSTRVCVEPESGSGYVGKCWKNAPAETICCQLPPNTTPVVVRIGQTHKGIHFSIRRRATQIVPTGSISGHVTDAVTGTPVQGAIVHAFSSTGPAGSASTDANGAYTVSNLDPSSTGYQVCVTADRGTGTARPDTGWAPRCYADVSWTGSSHPPSGAAAIPLSSGESKTGIDIALRAGGAISGTVSSSDGSITIPDTKVLLLNLHGNALQQTTSGSDGSYRFSSLRPVTASSNSGYIVCFDGRYVAQDPYGFQPQCYDKVAWAGFG